MFFVRFVFPVGNVANMILQLFPWCTMNTWFRLQEKYKTVTKSLNNDVNNKNFSNYNDTLGCTTTIRFSATIFVVFRD